jgi:nucleoside-diphosphate-sugar epimerase
MQLLTRHQGAVEGTVRVLRQAQKLGIKHFSVVSSVVAVVDFGKINADLRLTENGEYLASPHANTKLIKCRLEQHHPRGGSRAWLPPWLRLLYWESTR